MIWTELHSTLISAVRSGQTGEAVAFRACLVCQPDDYDPARACAHLWELTHTLFSSELVQVACQVHHTGSPSSVQLLLKNGATATWTLLPADHTRCDLVLLGQRGIVQLQGGDQWDGILPPHTDTADWKQRLAEANTLADEEPL